MGFCHVSSMAFSVDISATADIAPSCNVQQHNSQGSQICLMAFALVFLGHALEIAEKLSLGNIRPNPKALCRNRRMKCTDALSL
jgi:hypothetical protein